MQCKTARKINNRIRDRNRRGQASNEYTKDNTQRYSTLVHHFLKLPSLRMSTLDCGRMPSRHMECRSRGWSVVHSDHWQSCSAELVTLVCSFIHDVLCIIPWNFFNSESSSDITGSCATWRWQTTRTVTDVIMIIDSKQPQSQHDFNLRWTIINLRFSPFVY